MRIEVEITRDRIGSDVAPADEGVGADLSFLGIVRPMENGTRILGLEYEAYEPMALEAMRRILEELAKVHPCIAASVVHRVGFVPAGEAAIAVHVTSAHRAEALQLLEKFMNQLKQDVPIWKVEARPDLALACK